MIEYRTLENTDFDVVFKTMDEAFSDYLVKMEMTREIYQNKLDLEGVEFEHSVGAFEGDKLVGATMNAPGEWNGKRTIYDSGTGVIPDFRGMGIGRGMFDFVVPILKRRVFEQYLLEVIVENDAAFELYRGLGFEVTRDLKIYQAANGLAETKQSRDIEIRPISGPNWSHLTEFWTCKPSWQNSVDWVKRARIVNPQMVILGVYHDEILIGYGTVFPGSGKIAQIAVEEEFRRRGFGSALLGALNKSSKKPLMITNIESEAMSVIGFLKSKGFTNTVSQYEMTLKL